MRARFVRYALRYGMSIPLLAMTFGVSPLSVGSASAGWFVAGSELGAGKSAAVAGSSDAEGGVVGHMPVQGIDMACEGPDSIVNGKILAPNLEYVESVRLLQCHTIAPTNTHCQLQGGVTTVTTLPVLALATLKRVKVQAITKKLYTSVTFEEGTTCVLEGEEPVQGPATAGMPSGETELVGQTIEGLGSLENNSLELGTGNKLFVTGQVLGLLASHSKWSFK